MSLIATFLTNSAVETLDAADGAAGGLGACANPGVLNSRSATAVIYLLFMGRLRCDTQAALVGSLHHQPRCKWQVPFGTNRGSVWAVPESDVVRPLPGRAPAWHTRRAAARRCGLPGGGRQSWRGRRAGR